MRGGGGRGEVDDAPWGAVRDGLQRVPKNLGAEYHAGTPAEGAVVHMPERVAGEGAIAVGVELVAQFPESAARDTQAGAFEILGKEGEAVEPHQGLPWTRARKAETLA